MCDNDECKRLAADLYLSDLMLGKQIGSRLIRKMSDNKLINSHRDLFAHKLKLADSEMLTTNDEGRFSDTDKQRIFLLNKQKINLDKYLIKAETCLRDGIHTVSWFDDDYPQSMRNLEGMPIVLYYKGKKEFLKESGNSVAVVGSRNPSHYGLRATNDIVKELCFRGVIIVSGLARGIDTAAHQAALKCDGKTIAVTACGLDRVYPPENRELFEAIERVGLLVSEMPPGQEAIRRYFPARNRIMSALSDAVSIMEAGEFSGTLHTASFALAQGRDVFVLPASIYSAYSRGNLMLLRDGADILLCADDILSRLIGSAFVREMDQIRSNLRHQEVHSIMSNYPEKLTRDEQSSLIISELSNEDQTLDELVAATGISIPLIAPLLSELILSGAVTENYERFALTFPYL